MSEKQLGHCCVHLSQNSFLCRFSVTNDISLFILWQVNSHACGRTVKACGSFPSHLKHGRPPSPLSSRLFTEALRNCLRYLALFHLFNCSGQILGGRTCWYPIRGLYDSSQPRCNTLVIWTAASPLHTFIRPIVILPAFAFSSCSEISWQTDQKMSKRRLDGFLCGRVGNVSVIRMASDEINRN